jgi:DNA-binding beta-propeller fold protein YncE
MPLLVTSAAGANGDGYGALLAFDCDGKSLGAFSDDSRIVDPRGLAVDPREGLLLLNSGSNRVLALSSDGIVVHDTGQIEGLNPGGGKFGPDGRYHLGSRNRRTVMVFAPQLSAANEDFLPAAIVPFPRGFAFGHDGTFYLASGIGPNGMGDNAVFSFPPGERARPIPLVSDPELSPLDLAIAPNGNIVVSSEHPFGAAHAVTTVREYDARRGHLIRVFSPGGLAELRRPRGLRFGRDGQLYCVAQDEVVSFDAESGKCLGVVVRFPRLHGQPLVFFPELDANNESRQLEKASYCEPE